LVRPDFNTSQFCRCLNLQVSQRAVSPNQEDVPLSGDEPLKELARTAPIRAEKTKPRFVPGFDLARS
jgi:hypothetical protein